MLGLRPGSMKRKRRLSEVEIERLRSIMESAPQGKKPTIRQLSRLFGVNQPSIVKSLGGWEGNFRNRPMPSPKPEIIKTDGSTVKIEEYTSKIETP
jgi:hypothetical protein